MTQILCRPDNIAIEAKANRSILESLLAARVPHPHACGGNAACSTCRIMILSGSEHCRLMTPAEKALAERLDLPVHIRLACQTRITGDVEVQRLVLDSADIGVAHQQLQAQTIGRQADTAIVALSLRGIANFDEDNFPYDIVYTLGRFYTQMGAVVQQYQGSLAGQNALRSLALFGLDTPADTGIRQAIQAVLDLSRSLADLNRALVELSYPQVQMTAAIHYGSTILLNADPQDAQKMSAFGRSVGMVTWMDEINTKLGTHLVVSPTVYAAAKSYLTTARSHKVTSAKGSSLIKLWEVGAAETGIQPLPLPNPMQDDQVLGWKAAIRAWLEAWSRF